MKKFKLAERSSVRCSELRPAVAQNRNALWKHPIETNPDMNINTPLFAIIMLYVQLRQH